MTATPESGSDPSPRNTWRARRYIAGGLFGLTVLVIVADILLPDDQFHVDPIALALLLAGMLLLLGIDPKGLRP